MTREYFTFTLGDSINSMRRALTDAKFEIVAFSEIDQTAEFSIAQNGRFSEIQLAQSRTMRHPLARLTRRPISVTSVTFDDDWPALIAVIPLAFLRGGG